MPHYYFDLVENGETVRDDAGLVLDDIAAAKAEARKALAGLVGEDIRDGAARHHGNVAIHIRDHTLGPVVLAVTYEVIDRSDA